ncbi:DUF4249 domain-containing protein [Oscillatoria amoena NRMC-F 0135]|nr:DUF4249 domain-containing protein [Oscillatoria amoena NRMC-F 0135]
MKSLINSFNTILIITAAWGMVACEIEIFPTLPDAESVLVVDAWINDKEEPQVVRLMRTQPYFENSLPPGVTGATVLIEGSDGSAYTFLESTEEDGVYIWTPNPGDPFGQTGITYTLRVTTGAEVFEAATRMGRVPPIDSITFRVEEGNDLVEDLYLAEFWAVDPVEPGDTYWIKAYKNGTLLNKPSEISLAYDAGFSRGGNFSGINFIAPIRRSINPFEQDSNDRLKSPYVVGDSVYVEIHSLSEASFDFLTQVITQTDRPGGFSELFATPLSNVSSNLVNSSPGNRKVVGFFNVASVSGLGRKFKSLDEVSNK